MASTARTIRTPIPPTMPPMSTPLDTPDDVAVEVDVAVGALDVVDAAKGFVVVVLCVCRVVVVEVGLPWPCWLPLPPWP
jgi:hypothetical protein